MLRLFLVVCVSYVAANTCPEIAPVKDFNFSSYGQGRWFVIGRYPHPILKDSQCEFADYTLNGDTTNGNFKFISNNKEFSMAIVLKKPDATNTARLSFDVLKDAGNPNNVLETGVHNVMTTDYDNYAIAYSCRYSDDTDTYQENSWILSRTKNLSEKVKGEIENFLKNSPLLDSNKYIYNDFNHGLCKTDH